MAKQETVTTIWECWHYDVWGNETEGFEVNDKFCSHRAYKLEIPVEHNNAGTDGAFDSAYPTMAQIHEALDIKPRVHLDLDGDDLVIYVDHESTSQPLGEMRCTSHESLSPIRAKAEAASVAEEHNRIVSALTQYCDREEKFALCLEALERAENEAAKLQGPFAWSDRLEAALRRNFNQPLLNVVLKALS